MKNSLTLILLASTLSACGGSSGGSDGSKETNQNNSDNNASNGPAVLTYDASKLAYFAVKHGEGAWQALESKKHSIDITDAKGDISIITVCDETGYKDSIDREVEVSHLRLTKSVTNSHWCKGLGSDVSEMGSDVSKMVTFTSEQQNIWLDDLSIEGLMQTSSSNGNEVKTYFSDLSGPKVIVASGSDNSTDKVYLYRKSYDQLIDSNTYTIDFLSEDAIELVNFSTADKEKNGFSYDYDYLPAITNGWTVSLYANETEQGSIPASFLQSGDLFVHYYGFGYDSQISVISDSQTTENPLTSTPTEYIRSEFTISADKRSVTFTPKTSPIASLTPTIHNISINDYNMEYSIDAERFAEASNTLTLTDFTLLPNYPGDLPSPTITKVMDATSYFNKGEPGQAGNMRLFITSDFQSNK